MISGLSGVTDAEIEEIGSSLQLNFSDNVRKSILKSMETIDVQACPGSGKTTLVAAKLILLSKKWPFQHRGICALSHTNVAKDEIIANLHRSEVPEARSLLRYPHFIGTIQEFVNRHLALPFLRSEGHSNITIDNDEYFEAGLLRLSHNQRFAIRIRGSFNDEGKQRAFLRKTYLIFREGELVPNSDALPNRWQRQANYNRALSDFAQFKQQLTRQNVFLFRDMYSYGEKALHSASNLSKTISHRFPLLILDEMQDTQKFQDDLLRLALGVGHPYSSTVQRFGDPDQAIFNGVDGENPNATFNAKSRDQMAFVLDGSHRYQQDIADKARPFSLNEIALTSEISAEVRAARSNIHREGEQFRHTIFVFDDNARHQVIEAFCELVSGQFSEDHLGNADFAAKVVGAVGADVDPEQDQLRIGHYWPRFRKSKSVFQPVFDTLIETIRHARSCTSSDFKDPYRTVLAGLLKLLDLANERDADGRKYRAKSLKDRMVADAQWEPFRSLIFDLLSSDFDDSERGWSDCRQRLAEWFDLDDLGDAARSYSCYVEQDQDQDIDIDLGRMPFAVLEDNSFIFNDTFRVELSTIHGVKGETHDATLILETKNRAYDIGGMIQHFSKERPDANNSNRDLRNNPHHTVGHAASKKFLRQLFVAMSRPKHLLCIAVHNDRLTNEKRAALVEAGWSVIGVLDEINS